jgi:hypothetical protein
MLAGGCGPGEPSEEVKIRYRWVANVDREVLAYACPEAHRKPLEAADPFQAAAQFVQRGKDLENWVSQPIDEATATPASLTPAIDSLRLSVALIANSFVPAMPAVISHRSECYGEFALNCNKRIRAQDVMLHIDDLALRRARSDYFRHRATVAAALEQEGSPLNALPTCVDPV